MTISIPQGQWYKWTDNGKKLRGRWEGSPRSRRFVIEERSNGDWHELTWYTEGKSVAI